MGGSGGGGLFSTYNPKTLQDKIRQAEESTADALFATDLDGYLMDQLANINQRDDELVNERLEEIKGQLGDTIDDAFDLRFGGSVAKHTYVDGLSDIDTLVVLRGNNEGKEPSEIKDAVTEQLRAALPGAEVSSGKIAITIKYQDGMEVQLIPAVRAGNKVMVPSWNSDQWSKIDPLGFQRSLTKWNGECGNKLVPTIKLVKAINATLPDAHQLSGYHVESLAVASFKNYEGPRTLNKMLPYFVDQVSRRVLSPVTDSTGQSIHVDAYLGGKKNKTRLEVSHVYERIAKRINNATAAGSILQWNALFGND